MPKTKDATAIIARVFRDYVALPRWVGWHLVGGNKAPLIGKSKKGASHSDPEHWRTLADCPPDRHGIVFNGDGLGGVDLDGCRFPDGALTEWAADWIERCNSYTEVSPSGTGVKIFLHGCPAKLPHSVMTMPGEPINGKAPQIEAYSTERYFTVTGLHLAGTPLQISDADAPKAWAALMQAMKEQPHDGSDVQRQGRNGALYSFYCSLRKKGLTQTEAVTLTRAENQQGNVARHPNFADGPLDERELDAIIRHAERRQEDDDRPVIEVRAGQLHKQASAAETALVAAKVPIYAQSNSLVRAVVKEVDAARGRTTLVAQIAPCDLDWLLRQLSQTVRCVKWHEPSKSNRAADVPPQLAKSVLASASAEFSELAGIIETPTMRPDGSLLLQPGYDPATGLLLINPPPMPAIPDKPGFGEAKASLTLLDGLLDEFPYVNDASRSVALSGLITPVVRGAMECTPMHVTTAPEAGSGKSYGNDLAAAIATGKRCPVLAAGDEEETEKRLAGAAFAGQSIISIDNVNGVLKGDLLSQMISQSVLEVRKLGSTGNHRIRNVATIFANGNNIEIYGDLVRRTIQCSLDPEMEDPTVREFKTDPFANIVANRGIYIAAALTIVRAHLIAGCPGRAAPMAGFSDWSRLVRGALVWLERADPVTTQEGLRVEDPATVALDLVIEAWAEALKAGQVSDVPKTVKELTDSYVHDFDKALREATRTSANDDLNTVKVGNFFKHHAGRLRKGVKLVSEFDSHRKQQTWRLVGWQELLAKREQDGKVVSLEDRKATRPGRKAVRKTPPRDPEPVF